MSLLFQSPITIKDLTPVCNPFIPFSFLICFLAVLREEAIKRIVERDGKTRAEAEKRIDSQITNSQRAQARHATFTSLQQCAIRTRGSGSGSQLDPDSIGSVDPDPDPGGQNDPQKEKKSVGWPLLRAEGFFYNLDVLYGSLGIGKL